MTIYEEAIIESRIESAENKIRTIHNNMESKKIIGKKEYLSYKNDKFIYMINLFRNKLQNLYKGDK